MGNNASSSRFNSSSTAEEVARDVDLSAKVAIVTGANTGIGKETARVLAKQNAHVILASRDPTKTEAVVNEIKAETKNEKVEFIPLDLTSLQSVRDFAAEFKRRNLPLHLLINNAGVMATPYQKTKDGFELQMGTNHFGHFLLTKLLLDKIKESAPARIVVLSSMGHRFSSGIPFDDINYSDGATYSRLGAYANSKLANILFAKELARRLQEEQVDVTVNAVHPGVIYTELARSNALMEFWYKMTNYFNKTIPQGAATTMYAAVAPEMQGVTGQYLADCAVAQPTAAACDMAAAKRLWELSERLTQEKEDSSSSNNNSDNSDA